MEVKLKYEVKIQEFYSIYKNHQKWPHKLLRHLYKLLLRYLFLVLQCLSSKSISASINFPNCCASPISSTSSQVYTDTELYIFMKEMLLINEKIFQKIQSYGNYGNGVINGIFAEYMQLWVQIYENKMEDLAFWKDLILKFFQYQKIQSIGSRNQVIVVDQNIKNVVNLFLLNKPQQLLKQLNLPHLIKRQNTLTDPSKKHKAHKQQKSQQIMKQLNSFFTSQSPSPSTSVTGPIETPTLSATIFNYIDQSDSGSDGELQFMFEKNRRQNINDIQKQRISRKYKAAFGSVKLKQGEAQSQEKRENERKAHFGVGLSDTSDIGVKLGEIKNKCDSFRKDMHNAIELLTNRRQSTHQNQKIQKTSEFLSLQPIPELPSLKIPKQPKNKKKCLSLALPLIKKHTLPLSIEQEQLLIEKKVQKQSRFQHSGHQNQSSVQSQAICLSDKYDKMSRNLLLNNTKSVYGYMNGSRNQNGIGSDEQYQYGDQTNCQDQSFYEND